MFQNYAFCSIYQIVAIISISYHAGALLQVVLMQCGGRSFHFTSNYRVIPAHTRVSGGRAGQRSHPTLAQRSPPTLARISPLRFRAEKLPDSKSSKFSSNVLIVYFIQFNM